MTYTVGQKALASDYMSFRGSSNVSVAYSNSTVATNALAALIGVGYGDRGYGQGNVILPERNTGDLIQASDWDYLRAVVNTINIHTGSLVPIEPNSIPGTPIISFDGSNSRVILSDIIANLDSNRFNSNVTEMTLTNVLNSVRTSSWTNVIEPMHEFTVDLGTEDAARFFFNSGGQIWVSGTMVSNFPGEVNGAIRKMLSQMGTVMMGATATTYTGTGGTTSAIGYYGLPVSNTFQVLFTHGGLSTYYYPNISYTLQARAENYTGLNGANGSLLRFQAIFSLDGYSSGTYTPTASGTLTHSVNCYRSNNLVTVPLPIFNTTIGIGP